MFEWLRLKRNPAQPDIVDVQGDNHLPSNRIETIRAAYKKIEVVNRGVNLIVDNGSDISIDVKDRVNGLSIVRADVRKKKLYNLLNYKPNPHLDAGTFKRNILMDLLIEGNAFIYFDGNFLYNLPASEVTIKADSRTFVNKYVYDSTDFLPEEIIHIRENSAKSIYRGESRILSALDSINALASLIAYQQKFLDNGTIPGIVLTTENPLSDRVKQRIRRSWIQQYSVKNNSRSPIILDTGFKLTFLGASTIKELDFENSVSTLENKILEAIGVPQVLLKSGNNANISPNIRLYYIMTVLPLVNKIVSGFERYFGYDLKIIESGILGLRQDLRDEGNFWTSMVNAGILNRNEARENFRYEKSDEDIADRLILPANVAGSAQDSGDGGRPPNEDQN